MEVQAQGKRDAKVRPQGFRLSVLSEDMRANLKHLDVEGDGAIDVMDIVNLDNKQKFALSNAKFMKNLLIVVCIAWFLTMGVIAGMTVAIINFSKESHISSGAVMVTTDTGTPVQTSNTDFYVNADGALIARNGDASSSRRLQSTDEDKDNFPKDIVIQTQGRADIFLLSPTASDFVLGSVESVMLFSTNATKEVLQLQVHGYNRISPTTVMFLTLYGSVFLTEESIFLVIDNNAFLYKTLSRQGFEVFTPDDMPFDVFTAQEGRRHLEGTATTGSGMTKGMGQCDCDACKAVPGFCNPSYCTPKKCPTATIPAQPR